MTLLLIAAALLILHFSGNFMETQNGAEPRRSD